MDLAPVVLFVYKRPWHTRQTVEALARNELASESELFIYSDAAKTKEARKKVQEVREYIRSIQGFKRITLIERESNLGLANSIIDGVTAIVNKYGKIIVVEDDLVTSKYFLNYMSKALDFYENDNKVASIHAYIYPIDELPDSFFIRGADCWGWATWKREWEIFDEDGEKLLKELKRKGLSKQADFNNSIGFTKMLEEQIKGKNDSWAIRWYMSCFLADKLTLYPGISFVNNIGNDSSGTHCGNTKVFDTKLNDNCHLKKIPVREDTDAKFKIEFFFKSQIKSLFRRIITRLLKFFYEKKY